MRYIGSQRGCYLGRKACRQSLGGILFHILLRTTPVGIMLPWQTGFAYVGDAQMLMILEKREDVSGGVWHKVAHCCETK